MRRLIPLVLLLAQQAFGAVPAPPTTAYTRGLLITTNAAQAAAYIGAATSGNTTNTYNTTISTNVNVINNLTVKGKAVSFSSVDGTNVNQLNLVDTATVTWAYDGTSNVTATAVSSGGGGASTWVPVATLSFVTTNVTLPLNGGTNFYVVLTNGNPGYFNSSGAPSSTSTNTTWTLTVAQDATGVRTMNWDTTVFKFPAAVVPVCTTNASAIDVFILTSSPVTAGKVFVTWQPDFR